MSVETLTPNPLMDQEGLSEEGNQRAIDLRKHILTAKLHSDQLERRSYQDYHHTFGREINEMLEEGRARKDVRRAHREAARDYKANEAAYQVQAVKDAAADGEHQYHTNFGT